MRGESTSAGAGASAVRSRGGGGGRSRFAEGSFADEPFPAAAAPLTAARPIPFVFSGSFPRRAMTAIMTNRRFYVMIHLSDFAPGEKAGAVR